MPGTGSDIWEYVMSTTVKKKKKPLGSSYSGRYINEWELTSIRRAQGDRVKETGGMGRMRHISKLVIQGRTH